MKTFPHLPLLMLLGVAVSCAAESDDLEFRDLTTLRIYHAGAAAGGDDDDDDLIWDIKDDTEDAVLDALGNLVMDYDESTDEVFDAAGFLLCSIDNKDLHDANGRLIYRLQGNRVKDASGSTVFTFSGTELLDGGSSGPALIVSNLNIQQTDNDNKLIIAALVGAWCGSTGIPGPI